MIDYLQIENFKSLRRVSLPLGGLSLFFGMNGMGKSSVLQALLLLRQSYWWGSARNLKTLRINGNLVKLGSVSDILCQNAEEEEIRFYLKSDTGSVLDARFAADSASGQLTVMRERQGMTETRGEPFEQALFDWNGLYYLGADHLAPQTAYDYSGWDGEIADRLGSDGRYVVPFLAVKGSNYEVPEELRHPRTKSAYLIDQTSAWMSEISPGVRLSAITRHSLLSAELRVRYDGDILTSDDMSPVNVGFGIPYVLPTIVELLVARPDDLVILENPESHLHPRGQAAIAQLIARVAARGTQVICESHSDHIINGVRLAVKQGTIDARELLVSYFDKDEYQDTHIHHIEVDSNGVLSSYPNGLLDEWGVLMAQLL
jgi:predicted ATPase